MNARVSALDTQEGGDHYKKLGQYQPWEVLHKWLTPEELKGFAKGTVIAYLAREEDKGGRLDIKKALHTLQIYLEITDSEHRPGLTPNAEVKRRERREGETDDHK